MFEIAEFRQAKNNFFKTHPQSPLLPEQKKDFHGLNYFPENPALRFALPLERYPEPARIVMPTSTGAEQVYRQIGQVKFIIGDAAAALQVYEADNGAGTYFIPFVDATAPGESYGGGRYLEAAEPHRDELILDFNLAYNPYCAYNDKWSCPLPPPVNRLKMRIEAGEKNFHGRPNG